MGHCLDIVTTKFGIISDSIVLVSAEIPCYKTQIQRSTIFLNRFCYFYSKISKSFYVI